LEKKIATFTQNNVDQDNEDFKKAKEDLDKIYDDIANGIKIRSKCNWYELGEKSTKYFLNLEKKMQNHPPLQN